MTYSLKCLGTILKATAQNFLHISSVLLAFFITMIKCWPEAIDRKTLFGSSQFQGIWSVSWGKTCQSGSVYGDKRLQQLLLTSQQTRKQRALGGIRSTHDNQGLSPITHLYKLNHKSQGFCCQCSGCFQVWGVLSIKLKKHTSMSKHKKFDVKRWCWV